MFADSRAPCFLPFCRRSPRIFNLASNQGVERLSGKSHRLATRRAGFEFPSSPQTGCVSSIHPLLSLGLILCNERAGQNRCLWPAGWAHTRLVGVAAAGGWDGEHILRSPPPCGSPLPSSLLTWGEVALQCSASRGWASWALGSSEILVHSRALCAFG